MKTKEIVPIEKYFDKELKIINSNFPEDPHVGWDLIQKIRDYVKANTANSEEVDNYIARLEEEWTLHGKIIIACDFDDTVSPWKFHNFDFNRVIDMLKVAQQTGAYIVIFTACNVDRYDEIKKYCKDKGLIIDAINETPVDLPYGKNGKIYANIFIDDRAGLHESLHILESAMYRVRGKRTSKLDDVA